jgi:hypothetical protein
MDEYNIYSKKELRAPRDARFRKKGDARVLENYIGGLCERYKTNIDLWGFIICDDLLDGTRASRKRECRRR